MHSTAKMRKMGYGWHVTVYLTPSHLPMFELCRPDMQVTPAHLFVYNVNIGIYGHPEVAPESFILVSKFKISSLWKAKVSGITSQT